MYLHQLINKWKERETAFKELADECYKQNYIKSLKLKNKAVATNDCWKELLSETEKLPTETRSELLDSAMLVLDDFLNAGCKQTRKEASEKAKILFKEYYGVDYKNRNER